MSGPRVRRFADATALAEGEYRAASWRIRRLYATVNRRRWAFATTSTSPCTWVSAITTVIVNSPTPSTRNYQTVGVSLVLAERVLETYMHGYDVFRKESGFSPAEQEVVFLSISRANECHYCLAAHSVLADTKSRVPKPVTDAIRDGTPIPDPRLAALSAFAHRMVETRGRPTTEDIEDFHDAGYTERQVVEIVAGAFVAVASPLLIVNMLVALFAVHLPNGFNFINITGMTEAGPQFGMPGYEVNLLCIAGLLALFLRGPTHLSVDGMLATRSTREARTA